MRDYDRRVRVLHVDDEPGFADVAATFMKREDDRFDIDIASSPREGLRRLDSEQVDCIVSDYDMPTQTGIEFLETVREEYPDLPFILYTGKGSEEVASDAISAGVTDYLQKGSGTSQYEVLTNRIRNAVDKYHAQTELADRQKRLNLFFEQSPLGVIEWDDQFNVVRMNDAAEELLGYAEGDLVGRSWEKIVSESDRDPVADVVDDLLENEGGYHIVNENVRKDGQRIVCEWHNRIVTDEDGTTVAIFSQFQDITEQREQKRVNNRRRHRLEQILKTVPGCVVQLDTDGRFVFANERAEEVLGLDRDELTDRTYNDPDWDIRDLNGDPLPDEELPFRRVRDSGAPLYGVKHEIQWLDGMRKVLLVNGAPLFDDDGTVESVVFSLTDVTDQEERDRKLERTQRRLELALETTETGVWEWNIQTDEVVWNASTERAMGLAPGEFEGTFEAFTDRVHPDDLPRVQEAIERAVETESNYRIEFRMEHADGSFQWVSVSGQTVRDAEGERMVGVSYNITERKERERHLETMERRFEAILENTRTPMFMKDDEGEYLFVNRGYRELFDLQDEEIIGRTDREIHSSDTAAEVLKNDNQVRERGEPVETEEQFLVDGDEHVFLTSKVPIYDTGDRSDTDEPVAVFGIASDITEQKKQNLALQAQNERLDDFAGAVSHDLRNPLRIANGRLELAREECDSEHLDAADEALDRMDRIIEDILWLAREGRDIGETNWTAFGERVDTAWSTVAGDTRKAELVGTDTGTERFGRIEADEDRLQQLLENLLRNAIEHGGEAVTVRVGRIDDGFYVEDDGPGIPEPDRDDVFETGYSTAETGTGFGLRIVDQIVSAHGWEIDVTESAEGGARFEVTGVEFTTA